MMKERALEISQFLEKLKNERLFMQSQLGKLHYANEIADEVAQKIIEEDAKSLAEVHYFFKPELNDVLGVNN